MYSLFSPFGEVYQMNSFLKFINVKVFELVLLPRFLKICFLKDVFHSPRRSFVGSSKTWDVYQPNVLNYLGEFGQEALLSHECIFAENFSYFSKLPHQLVLRQVHWNHARRNSPSFFCDNYWELVDLLQVIGSLLPFIRYLYWHIILINSNSRIWKPDIQSAMNHMSCQSLLAIFFSSFLLVVPITSWDGLNVW